MFFLLPFDCLGHPPSDCRLTSVLAPAGRPCLVLHRAHSALYAQPQFCGRDLCHQPAVSPLAPFRFLKLLSTGPSLCNPFREDVWAPLPFALPWPVPPGPSLAHVFPASCRRESGSGACLDLQVIDTVRSGRDREDAAMHHLLCGGLYKPRRRVRAGRV